MSAALMSMNERPVLVVGGAGFIGSSLASHLARAGHRVRIYDDLSRGGVAANLAWLQAQYGDLIAAQVADIRDRSELRAAVRDCQAVFHFAAQPAVTTSLADPRSDFDVNAAGTVELLEAVRSRPSRPPVVFTSTSKVYGGLPDLTLQVEGQRWAPADPTIAAHGIDEQRPLEFRTPYACSKGAADQYVLDYAHSYDVHATVLRLSCIYGPRQLGTEDQGWVAHFLLRAMQRSSITIYGDGRQVRDVLFVDDLIDALMRAWSQMSTLRGRAFNIGGGPANALSLLEVLDLIGLLVGEDPEVRFEDWRSGDQRYYVSNTSAFTTATGWRPTIRPRVGIEALHAWLFDHRDRAAPPTTSSGVIRA